MSIIKSLELSGKQYKYISLPALASRHQLNLNNMPYTHRLLLENVARLANFDKQYEPAFQSLCQTFAGDFEAEIPFAPSRILMQDFTGVPAIVDLAAMRDAVVEKGLPAESINPIIPVDLVVDHSIMVDSFASPQSLNTNTALEIKRNKERYELLAWAQNAFTNLRVVPPGRGICHQVNLEYLASVVQELTLADEVWLVPDTLLGTDSHTTMINAIGVLGWGVGGIEAEAALLGQAMSMRLPEVVGVHLSGKLQPGSSATDLVLTIVEQLRRLDVVGKFVEFCGPGVAQLSVPDRATIANMAPEYGATCGFFAVDMETLDYLKRTGRDPHHIKKVEAYLRQQSLFVTANTPTPSFDGILEVNLDEIKPSIAGPKRPQDRIDLNSIETNVVKLLPYDHQSTESKHVKHGDVVIAAITSCTNTSNPSVMLAAALLARNALNKGLKPKPWVKTSLAPGSRAVTAYLEKFGLQHAFDQLGFQTVGYGCTTCIGNSGPLAAEIEKDIQAHQLTVASVLSGNRNFEGRIHPLVKHNWLASPPLVVAFALAGTTLIDLQRHPLATDSAGNPVFLKDIWPSPTEIQQLMATIDVGIFKSKYADVFSGDKEWATLAMENNSLQFPWQPDSSYIQKPPFFNVPTTKSIDNARVLAVLGDSVTTDHISPAGKIAAESAAGEYLIQSGISPENFNSYGSRRGNHHVMIRGTFANKRLRNLLADGREGGYSRKPEDNEVRYLYDVAMDYGSDQAPLIVVAGKEYGTGSSRDWAAKGTRLLGIKAVIAQSFERIHRSNLIGMGVLPLTFMDNQSYQSLGINGSERFSLGDLSMLEVGGTLEAEMTRQDQTQTTFTVLCRIDTGIELEIYRAGGILPYIFAKKIEAA